MKAPEPGVIYFYRVDEGGVYRNIRRMLPGAAITVTGATKPLGNQRDKKHRIGVSGIFCGYIMPV
jgi:hypothetical protein